MTIKDEMAILGYLMLIAENTSRIADAFEENVISVKMVNDDFDPKMTVEDTEILTPVQKEALDSLCN